MTSVKSDAEAVRFRQLGNELFQKRQMEAAMEAYNNSILFAPPSSESFAYAFGNRSAVLFELKAYSECLRDIRRAESCTACPEKLKLKLEGRKEKCIANLGNDDSKQASRTANENEEIPELCNGPNPNMPAVSRDIVMEYNPQYGRRLMAAKDIEPGSVLIVEKPFASIFEEAKTRTTHCYHCHEMLPFDFIPCDRCTEVRFCSKECLESQKVPHSIECGEVEELRKMGAPYLAYKIFAETAVKDLAEHFSCQHCPPDRTKLSEGTYGLNPGDIYDGSFRCIWNLMTHHEKVVADAKLKKFLDWASKSMTRLVKFQNQWPQIVSEIFHSASGVCVECKLTSEAQKSEMISEYLESVFVRLTEITRCNPHGIMKQKQRRQNSMTSLADRFFEFLEGLSEKIASAIYPTASLMNHSCLVNVFSSYIGKTMVVRAVRPIKAGEEILTCYGPRYGQTRTEERKEALKKQYYFDCVCCACTEPDRLQREFLFTPTVSKGFYKDFVVGCPKCPETAVTPTCFINGSTSHKVYTPMAEDENSGHFVCINCQFQTPMKAKSDELEVLQDELNALLGRMTEQEQNQTAEEEKTVQLLDKLTEMVFPYSNSLLDLRNRVVDWLLKKGTESGMAQALRLVEMNFVTVKFVYGYRIEWAIEVIKFLKLASMVLLEGVELSLAPDGDNHLQHLMEQAAQIFADFYGENCVQIKEIKTIDAILFETEEMPLQTDF